MMIKRVQDLPAGGGYRLRSTGATNDRLEFPDGAAVTVLVSPADPDREPLVMEFEVPPGGMPTAPHLHPRQEETYELEEGSMEVLIGRSWSTLEAGESARCPRECLTPSGTARTGP